MLDQSLIAMKFNYLYDTFVRCVLNGLRDKLVDYFVEEFLNSIYIGTFVSLKSNSLMYFLAYTKEESADKNQLTQQLRETSTDDADVRVKSSAEVSRS